MNLCKSILLSTLLGATLNANTLFDDDFNKEFDKFQNFFNSIIQQAKMHNLDDKNSFLSFSSTQVNIYEKNNNYIIEYQLAGIEKEDIELKLFESNILNLKVEKKNEKEDKSKEYHTQQITYNYIQKAIQIPDNVDANKMDVSYQNGILKVQMPIIKPKEPKAKIIEIR
jgi:HSP20 family protein